MVMKTDKVQWQEATQPVKMLRNCIAAGASRKIGDIVEVNQKEHFLLTTKGWAEVVKVVEKDLGEPVAKKKRKTRKKKVD